uniref:Zgc:113279 n=1 Tax=Dicentrarchus labrax TaxID=13489 RepID=A0A8C4H8L8_DICLA
TSRLGSLLCQGNSRRAWPSHTHLCSIYDGEKVYLGVRVKMPVRDLLKNIRLAQGMAPKDLKVCFQRVKTRKGRRTRKHPTKSLEELSIIVEVLEEDLRTSNNCRFPPQSFEPPVSPECSSTGAGYNSDESDEMIPSPQSYMTYSPGTAENHQAPSPPGFMHNSLQLYNVENVGRDGGTGEEWFDSDWNLNSSAFFWTQLQKEESQLRDISDAVLFAFTFMALCSQTALLHAAKHNHHLMVADLISLGANINETNNSGKSCLHLSAEKGYIRVLEVLKHAMMDGVYVDVEATDNSGMSVLQCASVALKATVCELESNIFPDRSRLHTLHQEQMMETLECLLQMGSYLHIMV